MRRLLRLHVAVWDVMSTPLPPAVVRELQHEAAGLLNLARAFPAQAAQLEAAAALLLNVVNAGTVAP